MSLPIHLQSIKSSGVYRFVYDKSVISGSTAETLRLLVGYSDKGPFNTPVYITSRDEFIRTYGNISKSLEKKGIYFHRLALQALNAGPILCLNLKNFNNESCKKISFDAKNIYTLGAIATNSTIVTSLYDTNRFWTLNAEDITDTSKYIVITSTDTKDASCSVIVRKAVPDEYDITIREYYAGTGYEMPDYLIPLAEHKLNDYFMDIYVFKGKFTESLCGPDGSLSRYFDVTGTGDKAVITLKTNYTNAFNEEADALEALANDSSSNFIAGYRGTTIPFFKNTNGAYISLDTLFNDGYSNHKMLMNMDESKLEGKSETELNDILLVPALVDDNVINEDNDTDVEETVTKTIAPCYIEGFTYSSTISADNCLNVLTGNYGKGLQEALTNRIDVEYHYIVDTFDTSITNNKKTLAALAKKKDNCFAILNFPKIKNYITSGTSNTNNTLDFKKVIKMFPLPDDGASWCGYFTQVILSDGTTKTTIPSAGLVSNLFIDKWSSRQPYYIVAGSQYGRLVDSSLVGPDYAFSKTDRDVLEPYGINVIVYEPRRGTYINSEQTAKQVPVSGLSKIHIRELVIYLQNEIAELLESYRWELNTNVLRDKVKVKADVILETVKNNGGVYDYVNVCDDSNNTTETIDNELLILDTHIEPARGAGKMVEQLYIYRTGEMRSTLLQG